MAKWQVTHSGDFWEVYSFIGGIRRNWGGGYSSHAFPDAEQRAEALAKELNERDQPKWKIHYGSECFSPSAINVANDNTVYFHGRDANALAERFVALMNSDSEGHQQEKEGA